MIYKSWKQYTRTVNLFGLKIDSFGSNLRNISTSCDRGAIAGFIPARPAKPRKATNTDIFKAVGCEGW